VKLTDLDPKLKGSLQDGVLDFDCPFPACQAAGPHRVRVAISAAAFHERAPRPGEYPGKNGKVKVWQASGSFPDTLSIQPSIDIIESDAQGNKIRTLCWHGFITNGQAT